MGLKQLFVMYILSFSQPDDAFCLKSTINSQEMQFGWLEVKYLRYFSLLHPFGYKPVFIFHVYHFHTQLKMFSYNIPPNIFKKQHQKLIGSSKASLRLWTGILPVLEFIFIQRYRPFISASHPFLFIVWLSPLLDVLRM